MYFIHFPFHLLGSVYPSFVNRHLLYIHSLVLFCYSFSHLHLSLIRLFSYISLNLTISPPFIMFIICSSFTSSLISSSIFHSLTLYCIYVLLSTCTYQQMIYAYNYHTIYFLSTFFNRYHYPSSLHLSIYSMSTPFLLQFPPTFVAHNRTIPFTLTSH